jgi:hypothetical protein
LGHFHPFVGTANFYLGMITASRNKEESIKTAHGHFKDAVDCYVKSFGAQHPNYVMSVCMLIRVLRQLELNDDADAYQSVIDT